MRFFEFAGDDTADKLIVVLRNYIGRAASKKAPAKLNWNGLQQVLKTNGFELAADYETFKSIYDASPAVQALVKNFNDQGIELNVPGAPDSEKQQTTTGQTSQDAVDQTAASAAAGQLAQAQTTPKV